MKRFAAVLMLTLFLIQCKTPETSETSSAQDVKQAAEIAPAAESMPPCKAKIMIKCGANQMDACNVPGAKPDDRHRCIPENFCFDSRRVRVRCEKGTELTHAGCPGADYMKRCGGCIQIAAMMCGPDQTAVEVPECKQKGHGDCVPK